MGSDGGKQWTGSSGLEAALDIPLFLLPRADSHMYSHSHLRLLFFFSFSFAVLSVPPPGLPSREAGWQSIDILTILPRDRFWGVCFELVAS